MTKPEIYTEISSLFSSLAKYKGLYDYWISQLYFSDGGLNEELWNESTVNRMKQDVRGMDLLFTI